MMGASARLPVLVSVLLLLMACGAGEESTFVKNSSPGGEHELHVAIAEPKLGQGKSYVRVYLKEKPGAPIYETRLENDGVPFTARNLALRWTGASSALLCLRATDRPDRGVRINLGRINLGQALEVIEVNEC